MIGLYEVDPAECSHAEDNPERERLLYEVGSEGIPHPSASIPRDPKIWTPPKVQETFDCPFPPCTKVYGQHYWDIPSNFVLVKLLESIPRNPSQSTSVADHLARIQPELDCQICLQTFYDPVTTPGCGHTFCRPCLFRTADHTNRPSCPTCRYPLALPTPEHAPTNILLNTVIQTLFADIHRETDAETDTEPHTPIFVCTLALPGVACCLHVFEPRYRLMLRRCMEGDKRFGMVLPRTTFAQSYAEEMLEMEYIPTEDEDRQEMRRPHFAQYGTMLEVIARELLPDGRSLIKTIGRERFKIREWSIKDGYVVARTTILPDIERTIYTPPLETSAGYLRYPLLVNVAPENLTTNQLIYLTRTFAQSLRSSPRLSRRLRDDQLVAQLARLDSGGDPVVFAFWVGINMPMHEAEGYRLLMTRTVRDVYFLVWCWIGEMERQSWYCERLSVADG